MKWKPEYWTVDWDEDSLINRCNCPKCQTYKSGGYDTDHTHRAWYTFGNKDGGSWSWKCDDCSGSGIGASEGEASDNANRHWATAHYISLGGNSQKAKEVKKIFRDAGFMDKGE